eukprot:365542-Chlamydomonas_euryale.AAC.23
MDAERGTSRTSISRKMLSSSIGPSPSSDSEFSSSGMLLVCAWFTSPPPEPGPPRAPLEAVPLSAVPSTAGPRSSSNRSPAANGSAYFSRRVQCRWTASRTPSNRTRRGACTPRYERSPACRCELAVAKARGHSVAAASGPVNMAAVAALRAAPNDTSCSASGAMYARQYAQRASGTRPAPGDTLCMHCRVITSMLDHCMLRYLPYLAKMRQPHKAKNKKQAWALQQAHAPFTGATND